MNWLMHIIILQVLLGQVLSKLMCTNITSIDKCSCKVGFFGDDGEYILLACGLSTLELSLVISINNIESNSNQTQWEQNFGKLYVNRCNLHYAKCIFFNSGFDQINPDNPPYYDDTPDNTPDNTIKYLKLVALRLNDSLENTLSNLESVQTLDITLTKLILTNESFEGTPHLTKLYLRENYIEDIPAGVFKPLTLLQKLDLGDNKITKINSDIFYGIPLKHLYLDTNYLTSLDLNSPSLEYLNVTNNTFTSLTVGRLNQLRNITLNYNILETMPDQTFKNTSLVSIEFIYGNLTTIPQRFLENLDGLLNVKLKALNIEKLPENIIWNSKNITELSLASNRLNELPVMFFRDAWKLKMLDLSKNQIENINDKLLKPLENLEVIDLSNNLIIQINNYSLRNLKILKYLNLERNKITNIKREELQYVRELKTLKLAYNKISNLTYKTSNDDVFSLYYVDKVETIDLSNNFINCIDPGWVNLTKLTNINLSSNNFTVLRMHEIDRLTENVKIDLNNNPLEVIDMSIYTEILGGMIFEYDNKYDFLKKRHLELSSDKLICDCRNYEFATFLHYNQIPKNEQKLICNNGLRTEFSDVIIECDMDKFKALDKIDCFVCECTYRSDDESIRVNCSNRNLILAPEVIILGGDIKYAELNLRNNFITKLPNYEHSNIKKLNIGYNNLNTINITQLPKHLTELHLEHNDLKMISETNFTNILPNLKKLTMSSNPWICDCNAKNTINFVKNYKSEIFDLANITCNQSPALLYDLTEEDVCQEESIITVSMFLAVLCSAFGLGLLWMLYSYNQTKIKIWLYSHNITLWPISEESLDQDKIYDAFISYSHMDIELVEKHLVPGLEGGSSPLKLCLHYRDWVPGKFIPSQIAHSVNESRRIIIVLSQNYLESFWGRTEFRTAYSSSLNERRSRIIVILYQDISKKDLDAELKEYLSMNTYIQWGDKWFWEKLRYALPHRPATKNKTRAKII